MGACKIGYLKKSEIRITLLREEKQEKQRKRKRKREQKKKTSTENNTEGDLQVVKDKTEEGTEQDLPSEARTRGQPMEIKSGLVAKLVVIGKCLLLILVNLIIIHFASREKGGAGDGCSCLRRLFWCCS